MFSLYKFLFVFKRMGPERPSHMALTISPQEKHSLDEFSNAVSLTCFVFWHLILLFIAATVVLRVFL